MRTKRDIEFLLVLENYLLRNTPWYKFKRKSRIKYEILILEWILEK